MQRKQKTIHCMVEFKTAHLCKCLVMVLFSGYKREYSEHLFEEKCHFTLNQCFGHYPVEIGPIYVRQLKRIVHYVKPEDIRTRAKENIGTVPATRTL